MDQLTHPRLREIADYVQSVRLRLIDAVEATLPDMMHRVPSDGGWSGVQIIEHLGRTEGGITKMLEGLFATARASGLPAELDQSSVLGSVDRFAASDAARGRLEAPLRLRPSEAPDLPAVWGSLRAVRNRTLAAYATVDGRALTTISAPHPYFGPLDAYQWLIFIGKHEERHLAQLRRTLGPA